MKYLVFVILLACSSTSLTLSNKDLLPYKESSQLTKLNFEPAIALNITEVIDKREAKNFGFAYTGVQYTKTPIHFDQPLGLMTKNYLMDALSLRGIRFLEEGATLQVEVKKFWVHEVIEKYQLEKAKCEMSLVFHLDRGDKKWSGEYWTEFLSGGDLSDGTERLAPTLASCMNEVIEKLIKDEKFINLLK